VQRDDDGSATGNEGEREVRTCTECNIYIYIYIYIGLVGRAKEAVTQNKGVVRGDRVLRRAIATYGERTHHMSLSLSIVLSRTMLIDRLNALALALS
jgi:hypothetical protein